MNQKQCDQIAKHFRGIVMDNYDNVVSATPRADNKEFAILIDGKYPYNSIEPEKVRVFAGRTHNIWIGINSVKNIEYAPSRTVLIFKSKD